MANSDGKDGMDMDEDKAVWDAYTEDMRPDSEKDDVGDAIPEDDFEALLDEADVSEEALTKEKVLARKKASIVPSLKNKSTVSDYPHQLDKRTQDRLRKGKMPIEARLDLHGLNKSQAHEALARFIVACHADGTRCVLVITGKGRAKSEGDDWFAPSSGVLKESVPFWLEDSGMKDIVLKFCHAQPKDGGSGALYVYLKRKR